MPDHVRRAAQRAALLATLTLLAFVVVGPSAVLAEGPEGPEGPKLVAPADRPPARDQQPGDDPGYQLPFEPGMDVRIHQGWNSNFSHKGRAAYSYDFGLPDGTPVLAAAGGVVAWTHDGESKCGGWELKRDANYVTIYHPDGSATHYGHLAKIGVEVGQLVAPGQQIGKSGRTGYSGCLPHLHFQRQQQGAPVTTSIPVYFDAYPNRELVNGETIAAGEPACASIDEAPMDAFCGTYAPLVEVSAAYFSRVEPAIDFDWSAAAPGGYWLDKPVDGFSASWSGRFISPTGGIYGIRVVATDSVRVTIDGQTVFNYGSEHPELRTLEAQWPLVPGTHQIDIEHVDLDGDGAISFALEAPAVDTGRWSRCGPLNLSLSDC